MDKKEFYYRIVSNKEKIGYVIVLVLFIALGIAMYNIFGNKVFYDFGESEESKNYILAEYILGANSNGQINLYSSKTGKNVDSKNLGSESSKFVFDESDDLSVVYAFDTTTKLFYEVKRDGKKIKASKGKSISISDNFINSFDCEDGKLVLLGPEKNKFVYQNISSSKSKVIDLTKVGIGKVDDFKIVKNAIIVTHGNYISNISLKNFKVNTINIGEDSLSIHEFGKKLYIHNSFGKDRNKSILLDINANTLYINDMHVYKNSIANLFKNSNKDARLYYSEIIGNVSKGKLKQLIQFENVETKDKKVGLKLEKGTTINVKDSYATMGYVYSRNDDSIDIFSLKTNKKEFSVNTIDDFYMPVSKN